MTKSFEVAENFSNIGDISFRCEKCDSNLNQDTLISHSCDNQNTINKEDSINDDDNVVDEFLSQEKSDQFEVIIEYNDCDSSEETSDHNNFVITKTSQYKDSYEPGEHFLWPIFLDSF